MTESEIKAEVRLYALECIVSQLAATIHVLGGSPSQTFEAVKKQTIEGTRQKTFGHVSPAESDLYSGELEIAVKRLLDMQEEVLGKLRKR